MSGLDPSLLAAVARIAEAPRLLVGTDFDGTLAPLVDDPADSRATDGALHALRALVAAPDVSVVVLSGRSLRELGLLVPGVEGVRLVGGHGAERDVDAGHLLSEEQERLRARIVLHCAALVQAVPGALLERKPTGAAVHVRRAARDDAVRVLAEVREGPARWDGVHVTAGKDVLELSVVDVDKGRAFVRLRRELRADAALFVGDDVTDENVFAVLAPSDVAVKVGAGASAAEHRVATPDEVAQLLEAVARLRREVRAG